MVINSYHQFLPRSPPLQESGPRKLMAAQAGGPPTAANFHFGARIKLKHRLTSNQNVTWRLHSLPADLPAGTRQQIVSCYSGNNDDDWWVVCPAHAADWIGEVPFDARPVVPGNIIRLKHWNTGRYLHSHEERAHRTHSQHEVTCYDGHDNNDNWRVHLIQGAIRFEHVAHPGILHSHNVPYDWDNLTFRWGAAIGRFQELEVTRIQGQADREQDIGDLWDIDAVVPLASPALGFLYGARIKLRHAETSNQNVTWRLHSLDAKYPDGSEQQIVSCYDGDDDNDWWVIWPSQGRRLEDWQAFPVGDGATIRLRHFRTSLYLHSHPINAHSVTWQHEVTCYGGDDANDHWVVRFNQNEAGAIRFEHDRHPQTYLHSHPDRYSYNNHEVFLVGEGRNANFGEQEVTRFQSGGRDDNDLWLVDRLFERPALTAAGQAFAQNQEARQAMQLQRFADGTLGPIPG